MIIGFMLVSVNLRLQDRLLTLKRTVERSLARSYEAHLWEDPNEMRKGSQMYVGSGDSGFNSGDTMSFGSNADRLFENPEYLEQYVVYWNDSDVAGNRTITAEHEAYVSSENASYLRKV